MVCLLGLSITFACVVVRAVVVAARRMASPANKVSFMKTVIQSASAPATIGCYSPALKVGDLVFLSGQLPLDPNTMAIVAGGIKAQVIQVFANIKALCVAAGAELDAIVKLTVYLTDIAHAAVVNEVMVDYFQAPYPTRTSIAVVALPRAALVEIEAILHLSAVN